LPIITTTKEKRKPTFTVIQEIVKLRCSRKAIRVQEVNQLGYLSHPPPPPVPFEVLFDESNRTLKKEPLSKPAILKPGDTVSEKSLIIHSSILLNALHTVIKCSFLPVAMTGKQQPRRVGDSDTKTSNLSGGIFPFPYTDLFYHKDDLLEYKNSSNSTKLRHTREYNDECERHIDILVEYLYSQEKINLHHVEADWKMETPVTTFESLWLLMKPGADVYVKEHGSINAYVVDGWGGGIVNSSLVEEYQIVVWNLNFNGTNIMKQSKTISIPPFDGNREITSLPLFPIRFYKEKQGQISLEEQLVQRGKKFVQLAKGPAFREYNGTGLESKSKRASQSM
jgi:hypothetical protein